LHTERKKKILRPKRDECTQRKAEANFLREGGSDQTKKMQKRKKKGGKKVLRTHGPAAHPSSN
jgi:hypothetical protein